MTMGLTNEKRKLVPRHKACQEVVIIRRLCKECPTQLLEIL